MYKPQGHNALSPYLIVEDAEAVLDFIKAVFEAEPFLVHNNAAGDASHIEVRIDDSVLMLGQMPGARSPAHLHLYVENVDAVFTKAVNAGGRIVQEPSEKGDGDRRAGIADPSGTTWWIATAITPEL